MVSLSVLEKKVKSFFGKSEEGNERLFNKVEIYKEFPNVDYSAKFIWNHFNEKGTIKKIAGKVGYIGNKLVDVPLLKTSDDGSVYPTKAAFIASVENSTYKVIFDNSYSNELKVTVECDIKDSKYINDLLNDPKNSVVSISKEYNDLESIKTLYKFITSKAKTFRIGKTGLNKTPNMIIDDEIGLVPVDASIIATIDGESYIFNISSKYNTKEVSVECPLGKTNYINNLLESILTEEIKDEKGKLVKKSVKGVDSITQIKKYDWGMVGGLGDAKKEIQQYIEWPLKNPELFKKVNASMPKGILLIGPPGNGKTTIAKIIASQTESSFYAVSPKDINSMWVGGTEKNWGMLFDNARHDVRKGRSAIIFIDEIDGLYTSRGEMDKYSRISFGQFCQEMEGISDLENVVIIGATNQYQDLDSALVRPGRFTKKIYIGNPNEEGRKEILEIYTRKKPVSPNVDWNHLKKITEGYSGAELRELCDSAAFHSIERYCEKKEIEIKDVKGELIKEIIIEKQDFEFAMKKISDYKKDW